MKILQKNSLIVLRDLQTYSFKNFDKSISRKFLAGSEFLENYPKIYLRISQTFALKIFMNFITNILLIFSHPLYNVSFSNF